MYWYILWTYSFGWRCLTSLWFQLDFLNEILVIRPNSSSIIKLQNWGWEVASVTNSQFTKRGDNVYETTRREGEDCQKKGDNDNWGDNFHTLIYHPRESHRIQLYVVSGRNCLGIFDNNNVRRRKGGASSPNIAHTKKSRGHQRHGHEQYRRLYKGESTAVASKPSSTFEAVGRK